MLILMICGIYCERRYKLRIRSLLIPPSGQNLLQGEHEKQRLLLPLQCLIPYTAANWYHFPLSFI